MLSQRLVLLSLWTAAAVGLVGGVVTPVHAFVWSYYKTTSAPLGSTYYHGGTVASIQGYGMTACSTGSWTKDTAVLNGPGVVDNHRFYGTSCPGALSYSHTHPSSYAVCRTATAGGYYYAACPQGIA
jgi:hypothetical protein